MAGAETLTITTGESEKNMGIFGNLFFGLLYFAVLFIDVMSFFVLVRLVSSWRSYPWLARFDTVGQPLVNWFTTACVQKGLDRLGQKNWSDKTILVVGLLALFVARLVVTAFFNAGQ